MGKNLHYEWANNPHLVLPIVIIFAFAIAAFFVFLFTILRAIFKLDVFRETDDESRLDWSERMGRRNARANRVYTDPEFARERRLLTRSALCFVGGLAVLFAITTIFGDPS